MNDKQIRDLISENNLLKRELSSLKVRLEKMQKSFMKQHEEIHELRIKNGARHIGPYK